MSLFRISTLLGRADPTSLLPAHPHLSLVLSFVTLVSFFTTLWLKQLKHIPSNSLTHARLLLGICFRRSSGTILQWNKCKRCLEGTAFLRGIWTRTLALAHLVDSCCGSRYQQMNHSSSFVLDISSLLCALALRLCCDCVRSGKYGCITWSLFFRILLNSASSALSNSSVIAHVSRLQYPSLRHRHKMHLVSLGLQLKWSPPTRVHSIPVWIILWAVALKMSHIDAAGMLWLCKTRCAYNSRD